ncbi:hypothetical protein EN859_031980, partial [Mesorhizobium sp. M00.F.Ca.ET.216.01.1.1]
AFKFELVRDTVCLHRTPSLDLITLCCKSSFSDSRGRCTPHFDIFRLKPRAPDSAVERVISGTKASPVRTCSPSGSAISDSKRCHSVGH